MIFRHCVALENKLSPTTRNFQEKLRSNEKCYKAGNYVLLCKEEEELTWWWDFVLYSFYSICSAHSVIYVYLRRLSHSRSSTLIKFHDDKWPPYCFKQKQHGGQE